MTKERMIELIKNLSEEHFETFKSGINCRTFEYGWDNKEKDSFDNSTLIQELYYED